MSSPALPTIMARSAMWPRSTGRRRAPAWIRPTASEGVVAHNNAGNGISNWQNNTQNDTPYTASAWSNGAYGILHGAYGNSISYQDLVATDNAELGFGIKGINQEDVPRIDGATMDNVGVVDYTFVPESALVLRDVTFTGERSPAFTQIHDACSGGDETDPQDGECIFAWLLIENPVFPAGVVPFDFGWHQNQNTVWRCVDSRIPTIRTCRRTSTCIAQTTWSRAAATTRTLTPGWCRNETHGLDARIAVDPGLRCGSDDELQAPLALPLEVLGPAGTERIADVWLDETQLAAADSAALVLTLHNVVQAGSAELVVNAGEAIDVSEPFVHPDGRVSTAEIAIDPGLLVPGVNHLAFRYPRQVVDAGGRVRVSRPARGPPHRRHHPRARRARPAARDVASTPRRRGVHRAGPLVLPGRRTRRRTDVFALPCGLGRRPPVLRVLRSKHRGTRDVPRVSRAEAEDLASYIRSLPVPAKGRPYRPAFQPGTDNHGAAGAGLESILPDDASFGEHLWGAASLPADLPWDWPETVDTFLLPTSIAVPTFVRWLPRRIDERWFTRRDGELAVAEAALADDPSLEHAQAFMTAAMAVGRELLVEEGDHLARIDLLRYAAVKLWDWSRRNGFDDPDHGMPDGSPAFPYEVGFAFFEAADAPGGVPAPMAQTLSWWWAQLAANPGAASRPVSARSITRTC
ncbi:hypothetical protein OV079_51205 [Nannocystis pusilla]|uniref:Uncharacterized protein n=1 Tax=Nannocystis pusilla TaxID=889268 RepID=A0A9X3F1V9_9BACT|nr:hypothetical protein [Nannocystis pusilla]MCY1013760.1 hypothetical protein [Nannocystis pusilla]